MGSKRHVVVLDFCISDDASEKYIGVKEFKGLLENLYVPTVSTSGDGPVVGMAWLAFFLIARTLSVKKLMKSSPLREEGIRGSKTL